MFGFVVDGGGLHYVPELIWRLFAEPRIAGANGRMIGGGGALTGITAGRYDTAMPRVAWLLGPCLNFNEVAGQEAAGVTLV